jgi:hypothetical protein
MAPALHRFVPTAVSAAERLHATTGISGHRLFYPDSLGEPVLL